MTYQRFAIFGPSFTMLDPFLSSRQPPQVTEMTNSATSRERNPGQTERSHPLSTSFTMSTF
jgi:hypothetical protein